ncbi:MAG TPA: endonuclease/exonuclease/phosphatase family protein [Actinomycetes bacterium]|nr:endonuclease/exonuclease/phosphatase family protein [Actinomycetes bacterium]
MTTSSLNLLQLNIEYGGTGVSFDAVVETIRSSSAPVAALQEGCGRVPDIAAALGWPYFDNRTQVVSQLPLLDPPRPTAGVIYVELEPGRVVALINVHPASRGYGATRLSKGERLPRVLRREQLVRVGELRPSLDAAAALMRDGVPVVLLGDFNAPSHRDWTREAVGLRPHVTQSVTWPTSRAVELVGLVDAYRAVYPDPVSHPGLTWPAARPHVEGYNPAADGHPADRIDFMHVSPDITVNDVQIVGEAESAFSDLPFTPWPTDHRGLLATLQVAPVPPEPVVSVSRRLVTVGDEVVVRVIASGVEAIELMARDSAGGEPLELAVDSLGVARVDAAQLGVGRYDVVAVDSRKGELARASLWVRAEGRLPEVTTDRLVYERGDAMTVTWSWTPGNRADWVAVYARGADPAADKPLVKAVTGATVEGSVTFDQALRPKKWPLPAGQYTLHLLADDLAVSLAATDFDVN